MRVTSCVALSETGSEYQGLKEEEEEGQHMEYADMARTSSELRRAARILTKLRLSWPNGAPKHILIMRKEHVEDGTDLMEDRVAVLTSMLGQILPECVTRTYSEGSSLKDCDFVITLGGDGTVLQAAWLFQQVVPPILSFHLGTLGFLTVFEFDQGTLFDVLNSVFCPIDTRPRILLRMRLACQVVRNGQSEPVLQVLNEVAIDRGCAAMMAALEVHVDGKLLTVAVADGLLIATPTGSTAYSLSAGGPVVHPDVPCILLTPVSPHSLSFRPVILPDSASVLVKIGARSRAAANVSFDGRSRVQLDKGEGVRITASRFPVPTICGSSSQSEDWFTGLSTCFRWASK